MRPSFATPVVYGHVRQRPTFPHPRAVMSSNGETTTVLRGVTHGAVDFLIKPVRIEELRNLWQHVVRRRRDIAGSEVSAFRLCLRPTLPLPFLSHTPGPASTPRSRSRLNPTLTLLCLPNSAAPTS